MDDTWRSRLRQHRWWRWGRGGTALLAVLILAATLQAADDPEPWGLPVPGTTQQSSQLWGPLPSASGGPGSGRLKGTLRTIGQWEALFAEQWEEERPVADRLSRSPDSWDQYELAYDIDALTAIYLATGKTGYVDEGLRLLDNLVATAKPSRQLSTSGYHDDFRGWVTQRDEVRGQEVPLYESYLWRYGVWLLRLVREDPTLWGDPTRRSRYERLLAFAERDIFTKWQTRGPDDTLYRSRTHMVAHWGLIAVGLAQITAQDAQRRTYLQTAQAIDGNLPNSSSSLRGQLRLNPDHPTAYLWNDMWGATRRPGQDVSHGNAVIAYVVAANSVRVGWNNTDMRRFLDTFRLAVWPAQPRKGQPDGAEYVDGSGKGNGWFSDGFVKLGRFDPQLQHRLEGHDIGRSPQFLANGALNAALLACHGVAPTAAPRETPACRLA